MKKIKNPYYCKTIIREKMNFDGSFSYFGPTDINGKPALKDKYKYPYSYDAFVLYRKGPNEDHNDTSYSDRLRREDYKKFDECLIKAFGDDKQYFGDRNFNDIEKFLQLFCNNKDIKLNVVQEHCHPCDGFPYWSFWYFNPKMKNLNKK